MFLIPLLPLLPSAQAFLLFAQPLVLARMDPIVQPLQASQHTHLVVGGSAFQSTYSYISYASANCTTMEAKVDKSNYWTSPVFGRKGGKYKPLPVHEVRVYYLQQGEEPTTAFPEGLKMLAGNAMSLNSTGNAYDGSKYATFDCQQDLSNPTDGLAMRGFPPYKCQGFLRASVPFPNCWDGKNTDSTDHHAHVAYAENGGGGDCPDTHPVRFPQLVLEFGYVSHEYEPHELIMSNGDTTGYSLHSDFAMGWNRNILSAALADPTCQHRQNLYTADTGGECLTLLPHADKAASQSCELEGYIPQEEVGLLGPLGKLPGCNVPWRKGDRPCMEADEVGYGRPGRWVGWSGVILPVWAPAGRGRRESAVVRRGQ
ncbi:hypothetical protein DACRYDRAFT_115095 [Dacryopinax primogenitus]|uniref:DUF1996 domain-containing protein n=1 Tax=Dacryopinax primogenitus (strain DJM 731) TaxID=1858805 RepID=M5G529_DACPD|nr:uncharacterized protein DACRYDRAFT_115095 [Dacryopinax primogenitus]EJU03769.1 hypothetical protein DACRYDRAFT_115095 [Dacryopinax primogenitus]